MGLVESQIPTGSVTPPPTNTLQRQLDCCTNMTQGPGTIEEGETEDLRGEGRMQQPLSTGLCVCHTVSTSPVGRDGCCAQKEEQGCQR